MNSKIRAIIIDDEDTFVSSLSILLNKNFADITIVDKAYDVKSAIISIKKHNPDLIFLDINLPDGTGFDLLEKLDQRNFEIIFTTSFSDYAIRAFEFAALHYLTKPIELPRLKDALDRFVKIKSHEFLDEKLSILKQSLSDKPNKILLPSANGSEVYNLADIVRFEAESNYSKVYFNNNKSVLISKSLGTFCQMLVDMDFVRIHNSHLINLRYVSRFVNGKNAKVVLTNELELAISQSQKNIFIDKLKLYAKSF